MIFKRESKIMRRDFIPIIITLFLAGNLFALENPSQGWGDLRYALRKSDIFEDGLVIITK